LRAALTSEEVRKHIIIEGGEPEPTTPGQHAAIIDHGATKWLDVVRSTGIKPE